MPLPMILMILVFTIPIDYEPLYCCRKIPEKKFNASPRHMQFLTLILPSTNQPYRIMEIQYLVGDLGFS